MAFEGSGGLFLPAETPHVAEVLQWLHDPAFFPSHRMTGADDFDCPFVRAAVFGVQRDTPGMPVAVRGADVNDDLFIC